MGTEAMQILDAIKRLPLSEKFFIIELIFRDIREETANKGTAEDERRKAAELLLADYQGGEELTVFTVLDKEDFHEAK
jgi:hypothetical protein